MRRGTQLKRTRIKPKRATPRRRDAPRGSVEWWAEADAALQLRSGMACECCGRPLNGTVERHHRRRRASGGDRLSNLLYLLPGCHAWITENPEIARENGWIVQTHHDPMDVPVLMNARWFWINDDGTKEPATIESRAMFDT